MIDVLYLDPAHPEHAFWRLAPMADYEDLQRLVGGAVQMLSLSRSTDLYLDEEGKVRGLPVNPAANKVVFLANPGLHHEDFICGPAALVGSRDAAGRVDGLEHSVGPDAYGLCAVAGLSVVDQREA